jgi:hypothetical protein
MINPVDYLYRSRINYWNVIQFLILVGIFSYYFLENFVLSASWEVLTLRSIDDYAMQDSVRSMQKALVAGNWTQIFSFFDYAYGNAFWILNSILLLPFYLLNEAQAQIIIGRQISLFFVFGGIYIIGLIIDRIRPDAIFLKYPVLIAIASTPMVAIISTKLHVNAQTVFFGILSFYLLIRDDEIKKQSMLFSSLFAGLAIGFKLTGIFIIPLLVITLLDKLKKRGTKYAAIVAAGYFFITMIIAVVCTTPVILFFPFYVDELTGIYKKFLLFKNMASEEVEISLIILTDSIRFYFSLLTTIVIITSFFFLIYSDIKKKQYISAYIFCSIIFTVLIVLLVVDKGPVYISTYILSLAFFIPLGLLGIATLKNAPNFLMIILAYCFVVFGLFYDNEYRTELLAAYKSNVPGTNSYFAMVKTEPIKRQILALEEMRKLVYPLPFPVRILLDNTSVFPATQFTDGVEIAINYGNLKEKSTQGDFDYILLNSNDYHGKMLNRFDYNLDLSNNSRATYILEEETRNTLRNTGVFYGKKYNLVYCGYDALLYKLEK